MNDFLYIKHLQTLQNREGEAANYGQTEALETVGLHQLIQVDAQEFKGDAEVIAEVEEVLHVHHVVGVVFVLPSESFQDLQLHQRLVVKSSCRSRAHHQNLTC